ncbi:hypothetical protein PC9H_000743 [Pleurotus ostreatus]|uniref:Trafficking protein particle complex subunit 10 n=1 Tax=Pleurotus ostreatus TaxID=5322 RepID=A0A8H7A1Q7_PLEOS|nr:uncharacterized protein PC9H_000743 [Pleurotus ostreatus]KAF7440398.1 hypothetical protein PC9H_000743 [Pleurotus ostreatus]KAJ8700279.1 hypothetical protein PTI98_003319 [Pleurotus ostreatus]
MSGERVLVSYHAPNAYLASESWKQIRSALVSQFPLRNLHWKSPSRSIKTIQELDLNLVAFDSLHDEHTSQVPATLLEKPLLNIYIVACEDTDFDSYKNTIKKQIKDWHSVVASRKHQEWLILHVVRPDARTAGGNFFQMKYSVFERIKTDFNAEKRDRCVQMVWSALQENPAVWADLMSKTKDGLITAFESAVNQREEDVRRSESQRAMPGWNFCTFFILKESLASSIQGLSLYEDAYMQYAELESSFQQVLKEKNASWFGTFIQPSPRDDSLPLLSTDKKPYRDLILANTISVFDLRTYILARQCTLLWKLGRINDVGRAVTSFLSTFGRLLRDHETPLPEFFVESWIYSSCLSVVEQCDSWTSNQTLEGAKLAVYNASKGELLELALNQLSTIGVAVGHLPSEPPFSSSSGPSSSVAVDLSKLSISNKDLLAGVNTRDVFDRNYIDTTNRAIDLYAKAGRRKFALKLHGSLAALDLYRGRLDAAQTTFASLPSHYAPHMWTSLEAFMLCRALHAYSKGPIPDSREWVSLVLSFMKLCIDELGMSLVDFQGDVKSQIDDLLESVQKVASQLDPELVYPDHPSIQVKTVGDARVVGSKDGAFLDVVIRNRLPCALPSSEIVAVLAGRDGESYRFTADVESAISGETALTLFSPSASPGMYLLDFTELRISGLVLQWLHKKTTAKSSKASANDQYNPVPIRIPLDHRALSVQLAHPKEVKLGETSQALVILSTGRNNIKQATLKITGVGGVGLRCQETSIPGSIPTTPPILTKDTITVADVPEDTEIEFLIPYSTTTGSDTIRVTIGVDYVTSSEPTVQRTMHGSNSMVTSLPLVINVQDFFRGTRLFSKFTISATTLQSVRVFSVDLVPSDGTAQIVKASHSRGAVVTVTPNQPAHFLFHLDLGAGSVPEIMHLTIKYRLLREEVELLVDEAIKSVFANHADESESGRLTAKEQVITSLGRSSSWVERYCITGQLVVPPREDSDLGDTYAEVVELLSSHNFDIDSPSNWRKMGLPVDVPTMNIVAAAELSLTTPGSAKPHGTAPLYAGQPISAFVTIRTTFGWGPSENLTGSYILRYDIEEMVRDWLLSGPKRGEFEAKHDSSFTAPVTLIALHHGELELPKVSVQALPLSGGHLQVSTPSMDVHQVHGAERALVLPRGGRSTFVVEMGAT